MQVNTLLKDVTHWCVVPSSVDEPATPNLKSDVLTTRPMRLDNEGIGWITISGHEIKIALAVKCLTDNKVT